MRVHVLNKKEFDGLMKSNGITDDNVEKMDSIMFISIVDTAKFEELTKGFLPHFKENHENVMNLEFDDIEHDVIDGKGRKFRAFSEKQAKDLYEFIKRNREKETCIVHCMAGISRSGAVGSFVQGYSQGDWELFKRDNPFISPNGRVSRMLNSAKYNDY